MVKTRDSLTQAVCETPHGRLLLLGVPYLCCSRQEGDRELHLLLTLSVRSMLAQHKVQAPKAAEVTKADESAVWGCYTQCFLPLHAPLTKSSQVAHVRAAQSF